MGCDRPAIAKEHDAVALLWMGLTHVCQALPKLQSDRCKIGI